MKFYCIADQDTVRGFRLAGVDGREVSSVSEAETAFAHAVSRPELGILILTERVAVDIRQQVEMSRMERDRPLIVEIRGPAGPMSGHRSLRQFVQAAVGVRVGREEGR